MSVKKLAIIFLTHALYATEDKLIQVIKNSQEIEQSPDWQNGTFDFQIQSGSAFISYQGGDGSRLNFSGLSLLNDEKESPYKKGYLFRPGKRQSLDADKKYLSVFKSRENEHKVIYSCYNKQWPDPLAKKAILWRIAKGWYDHITYPEDKILTQDAMSKQPYVKTIYDQKASDELAHLTDLMPGSEEIPEAMDSTTLWYQVNIPKITDRAPSISYYKNPHGAAIVIDYGDEKIRISNSRLIYFKINGVEYRPNFRTEQIVIVPINEPLPEESL
jgi:hypothetical protein